MYESVDSAQRGSYMERQHGIAPQVADDALDDPYRVVIDPDYNSASGRSVRIIGYSMLANDVITVIVLVDNETEHGVNGWHANTKDRSIYSAALDGEDNEQQD